MEKDKECPLCAEFVKAKAQKCRYCAHWFNKNPFNPKHPYFGVILIFFIYFGFSFSIKYMINGDSNVFSVLNTKKFHSEESGIIVESHRLKQREPHIKILGKIRNTGSDGWSGISMEAHLYKENGELVDILTEYISGEIPPGSSRFFKFGASCTKTNEVIEFESYKIFLKNAYYEKPDN